MTSSDDRQTIVHAATAAGAVLVLVLLGITLGWPVTVVVLLVVVLAGVVAFSVWRLVRARRAPGSGWEPRPAPARPEPREPSSDAEPLGPMPVHSATDGYAFTFSATAHWRPRPGSPPAGRDLLRAQACELIVDRAGEIARHFAPSDSVHAELRLAHVLGLPHGGPNAGLDAWATNVAVSLGDEDRARLDRLDEITKNLQLTEHERARERDLRQYLGNDVLTSTGSALVWWLARHVDEIDGAIGRIPVLARISAVAQDRPGSVPTDEGAPGTWVTDGASGPVPDPASSADSGRNGTSARAHDLIACLFPDDEAAQRRAAHQFAGLADRWERNEFAASVRQGFPEPAAPDDPGAAPTDPGTAEPGTPDGPADSPVMEVMDDRDADGPDDAPIDTSSQGPAQGPSQGPEPPSPERRNGDRDE